MILVLEPPPIRGLSQTGGFEFMIEDRDGKGVEALARSPISSSKRPKRDGAAPELAPSVLTILRQGAPAPLRLGPH